MADAADPRTSDPIWMALRAEAHSEEEREPWLSQFIRQTVLKSKRMEDALSLQLSTKLATESVYPMVLRSICDQAFAASPETARAIRADLQAIRDRDPAARGYLAPFLYYQAFHALQAYRVAHWLWGQQRSLLAIHLQNRIAEVLGVDIHPAARLGAGILIDHGAGVVIGETALVENNVSFAQGVTLGGIGREPGDRHPKIREGVTIGPGASLLGNIEIGAGARIGPGAVVVSAVPAGAAVS